jgi:hypothetical protein
MWSFAGVVVCCSPGRDGGLWGARAAAIDEPLVGITPTVSAKDAAGVAWGDGPVFD